MRFELSVPVRAIEITYTGNVKPYYASVGKYSWEFKFCSFNNIKLSLLLKLLEIL